MALPKTFLLIACSCGAATPAFGQSATWLGGTGNWASENWSWQPSGSGYPDGPNVSAAIHAGTVELTSESVYRVENLGLSGGQLRGAGTVVVTGKLTHEGSVLASNLSLEGAGSSWSLGAWSAGTTTIGAACDLVVSGSGDLQDRNVVNYGSVDFKRASLFWNGSSAVRNFGSWLDNNGTTGSDYGGWRTTNIFENGDGGVFTKAGTGESRFREVQFYNNGTVNVLAGILDLADGGASSGDAVFDVKTGAQLLLRGYSVGDGTQFKSAGALQLARDSDHTTNSLTGSIGLSGTLRINSDVAGDHALVGGRWKWTSGTFKAGTTVIEADTTFELNGQGFMDGRSIVNHGTVESTQVSSLYGKNGGGVWNYGTWMQPSGAIEAASGHAYTFHNAPGSLFRAFLSSSCTFRGVQFENAGAVEAKSTNLTLRFESGFRQIAGSTTLEGAKVEGTLDFDAGALRGMGTITGLVSIGAAATLEPGLPVGKLSIKDLVLMPGSHVVLDLVGLAANTEFDVIEITRSCSITDSVLVINTASDLHEKVVIGTKFEIGRNTSSQPIIGAFAGLAEGSRFITGNIEFEIRYAGGTGNDLQLTVTNVIPAPPALSIFGIGPFVRRRSRR